MSANMPKSAPSANISNSGSDNATSANSEAATPRLTPRPKSAKKKLEVEKSAQEQSVKKKETKPLLVKSSKKNNGSDEDLEQEQNLSVSLMAQLPTAIKNGLSRKQTAKSSPTIAPSPTDKILKDTLEISAKKPKNPIKKLDQVSPTPSVTYGVPRPEFYKKKKKADSDNQHSLRPKFFKEIKASKQSWMTPTPQMKNTQDKGMAPANTPANSSINSANSYTPSLGMGRR